MSKWKCGICNNEFNNYQAQDFNGTIYCPLCYFKELYRREKTKNDKATKYIEELLKEEVEITDEDNVDYGMKCQRAYFSDSELIKVLEILGDKEND